MLEILNDICAGKGTLEDLDLLGKLGQDIKLGALCGLGQTAPNPVQTTLRYFRSEYEAHILDRKCPAGVCKPLFHYEIDLEKCTGCGVCLRQCPVQAVSGEKKAPHAIDLDRCTKCGSCFESCKFEAIRIF